MVLMGPPETESAGHAVYRHPRLKRDGTAKRPGPRHPPMSSPRVTALSPAV